MESYLFRNYNITQGDKKLKRKILSRIPCMRVHNHTNAHTQYIYIYIYIYIKHVCVCVCVCVCVNMDKTGAIKKGWQRLKQSMNLDRVWENDT